MKKRTKKKKTGVGIPMSPDELIEAKSYKMLGWTAAAIGRKMNRANTTIGKALKEMDERMLETPDFKRSVMERFDEIKEQMLVNSEAIIFSSDEQVLKKISSEETTAMDAARISDIYSKRILNLSGQMPLEVGGESGSPRVINFINNIINITKQKDDRLEATSPIEGAVVANDTGRETAVAPRAV